MIIFKQSFTISLHIDWYISNKIFCWTYYVLNNIIYITWICFRDKSCINKDFLKNWVWSIISFIDSNYLFYMIEEENRKKPVLFNFENWGSRRNDNQHVKLQTEYRLYTYYNSTKYYLDIKGLKDYSKNLELRSTESKNTVKGSLHI